MLLPLEEAWIRKLHRLRGIPRPSKCLRTGGRGRSYNAVCGNHCACAKGPGPKRRRHRHTGALNRSQHRRLQPGRRRYPTSREFGRRWRPDERQEPRTLTRVQKRKPASNIFPMQDDYAFPKRLISPEKSCRRLRIRVFWRFRIRDRGQAVCRCPFAHEAAKRMAVSIQTDARTPL
jgi:hypothetical protein